MLGLIGPRAFEAYWMSKDMEKGANANAKRAGPSSNYGYKRGGFIKGGFHKPNFKVVSLNKFGNPKDKADFVGKPNRLVYPVVITREPGKSWYHAEKWVQGHTCKKKNQRF